MKSNRIRLAALSLSLVLSLSSCSIDIERLVFGENEGEVTQNIETQPGEITPDPQDTTPNRNDILVVDGDKTIRLTAMTVITETMPVYAEGSVESKTVRSYKKGTTVTVEVTNDTMWRVYDGSNHVGYCEIDNVIYEDAVYYAELPVEYGTFTNGYDATYSAKSHLVDVRKYNDLLETPMIIDMICRTYTRKDGKPFYNRNLCLLQYDTLMKLLKAQAQFNAHGYTIKIYDAYRPTSVQWAWYEIVNVHKWVANPNQGNGGVHDRGVAVDISLVNIETGQEVEVPTPMHTFSDLSARNSSGEWSYWAKYNVENILTPIMVECGFDIINSEWWHFQDKNLNDYLPTDHPIDEIPLVIAY
ncbi:MAG: M15 family metallopeptidase [Firmicutes bacterium]|nr:M15 family metallopeptidase [Bacillota bacterium]